MSVIKDDGINDHCVCPVKASWLYQLYQNGDGGYYRGQLWKVCGSGRTWVCEHEHQTGVEATDCAKAELLRRAE